MASIPELRRICQDPVRERNDLAGAIYGSRISIVVTALFLRLGLGANSASRLMLLSGSGGSLLLLLPGWWRVAGLVLVMVSYIFDCVDGEIARYHKIDSYRWAAFDYVHHMIVKGLAFLCLGIGLYLEYGTVWAMAAGGLCSVLWLVLMAIRDLAPALFTKKIVLDDRRALNPAYLRLVENLRRLPDAPAANAQADAAPPGPEYGLRPWVVRTFLVSFDLVVPLFLAAALFDRLAGPFHLAGAFLTPVIVLIYAYAVFLPLHAVDLLLCAMTRGGLRDELYDLARRIESFKKR
ncbi:MAG: hypothetical protein HY812_15315 [Planctomycetes bacterium]|nr:hypothetical protein [Planctomycetota bacterium]